MKKDEIREEHIWLLEQVAANRLSETDFHKKKDELYKKWKDAED